MKKIFLLALSLILFDTIHSQNKIEITPTTKLINGFSKEIEGENLPYRSSYPEYAKVALLTRATDGKKIISWETDPIPTTTEQYIYFYWLAGHSSGTSKADRHFDLFINDEKILTFVTPMKKNVPFNWQFEGKHNIDIMFEAVKQDAVDDVFGNMYLRLPSKLYKPGSRLIISVIGQNENSPDWYMTFKYSYEEKIDIVPIPAIIKKENKLFRAINIKIDHIGDKNILKVEINKIFQEFTVSRGFNDFDVIIPNNETEIDLDVSAEIPDAIKKKYISKLKPAALREIHMISHSHNDIGYSNFQEEVEEIQNKNIDDALRWIEKTKNYPEEIKYRWNIESLWALDNYLRIATTEKKEKLFEAIKLGSIGLSAFYSHNLTGITKPEEFDWLIEYSKKIGGDIGVKISNAMITDIPGVNSSILTTLVQNGIKYFSSGQNYFTGTFGGGDRVGYSNYAWGDKPFYWKSPSKNGKVLFWMAGRGYSYFHSFGPGDLFRRGKEHILNYMRDLDSLKYPYDIVQLRYSIRGDNGPTDSTLSDFAKQWNEKYYSPKIVLSTIESMFEKFEKKYENKIQVISGEFSPYWEDGAMSTAHEENTNRLAADRINQYGILSAIINPNLYETDLSYSARRNVVLFHEHTWGAWNSISDPDNPFVTKQWEYKKRFVDNADSESKLLMKKLTDSIKKENSTYFNVYNTASWTRNEIVTLEKELSKLGNQIVDVSGNHLPTQILKDGRLVFFAKDVPALGSKKYKISKTPEKISSGFDPEKYFSLQIDQSTGAINSMKWEGIEFVNPKRFSGLVSFLYVAGRDPKKYFSESNSKTELLDDGDLITRYLVKSDLQGTTGIEKEITLLKPMNQILVRNTIDKLMVRDKEAVHIAFPFAVENPNVQFDIGWKYIQPDKQLLNGSNKDYFCTNKWVDVSNDNFGVTISPLESPLFEVGEMINEDNSAGSKIWKKDYENSSTIFSYAMNNYWHTNYKADQSGKTEFNFLISPHKKFRDIDAYQIGTEFQSPLIVIPVAANTAAEKSLFQLSSDAIMVSSITPKGKGIQIKLFNASNEKSKCRIIWDSIEPELVVKIFDGIKSQLNPEEEIEFLPFEVIQLIVNTK